MADMIPESEVETVVAPTQANNPGMGSAGSEQVCFEEMDYDMFCDQYTQWQSGVIDDAQVMRRFGVDILQIMQLQTAMESHTQLDGEDPYTEIPDGGDEGLGDGSQGEAQLQAGMQQKQVDTSSRGPTNDDESKGSEG
ncbi:unnamed protein product [Symbiodinium sp. CCMP2592]|nr:unnamed protein product [Symbiodinium sp. CCMP2592]